MDLAEVDAGGSSLMWSWWSLILCMCATWSSVRDGTGLVRTGLLDGAPEVLTRLDVVLVQQVSIPLLKVADGAKVLVHSLHTWEDFLKLVDACYGFDGPAHGAHAVGVQTMVAVDSSARMVTLHKAPGGCEYVIGDAGCPQVIAGVWSTCNHAAGKSADFHVSCFPSWVIGKEGRTLVLCPFLTTLELHCLSVFMVWYFHALSLHAEIRSSRNTLIGLLTGLEL